MLTGQALIFNLNIFEQFTFVNNHLLCYWPTMHDSISKICPKFQILSSHFFKVNELLDEHWAKLWEMNFVQLQSMSNVTRCFDQRFVFKNSSILCLALIFNLSNPRTTILHAKTWKQFEVARVSAEKQQFIYSFLYQKNTEQELLRGRLGESALEELLGFGSCAWAGYLGSWAEAIYQHHSGRG